MKRSDEKAYARRTLDHLRRVDAVAAREAREPEKTRPPTLAGFWPIENRIWLDEFGEPEPEPVEWSAQLAAYEVFRRHRQ